MFRRKKRTTLQETSKPNPVPKASGVSSSKSHLLSLESRLMFDAAATVTAAEVSQEQVAQEQAEAAVTGEGETAGDTQGSADNQDLLQAISTFMPNESRAEVVFVDPTVPNYRELLNGMDPNIEVVLLDSGKDGVQQMVSALEGRTGIDAIHIISHGSSGELYLGTGTLNVETMSDRYANDLAIIQHALSEQAYILVYGCGFAQGDTGQIAVDTLAQLTGADVEASNDQTGSISLGGDWDLEVETGIVETHIAVSTGAQMNWVGLLGTETVKDRFSSTSYSNNNGTQSWSTSWSETDAGGNGASGGDIRVNSGQLRVDVISVGDAISRGVNLSGATSATLSFNYTNSMSSGSSVSVRISRDGGASYQTLSSGIFSNSSHTGSGTASFDISSYMSANTKVQFVVTGISGSGGDRLLVDNVQVSYTANSAPTISNLGGNSLSYTEGAGAVVIDQGANALVADADSANFDTGTLTVSIPSGAEPTEDVLSILNQGTGAGQIGVSGGNVTYGGVTIGTFTGGAGGNNLVITFNSNATPTAVTALVKSITYEDINTDSPVQGGFTIRFVLTDGDGGISPNYDTTVTVSAVNDAPVLADTALTLTVTEDAGAPSGAVGSFVSAFTGGITDVDSGASKGIAITGSNQTNGTWYYTTNGGTTWTVVGTVSNTSALLLADNGSTRLYFVPNANYNGTSSGALTLRAWDQTSGSAGTKVSTASNGGSTAFSSATDIIDVTVTAVNDASTITNLNGDSRVYNEGAGAVVIEQGGNALVADVDSTNLDTGTLTVSIPAGGDISEDVLSIRNQGTGVGKIGVSGSTVTYGGTAIGTFAGGSSGNNLVITLNSNATPTAVTALLRNITYRNTDTNAPTTGARIVWFVLTDGDGGTSPNYDTTVIVRAVNDAPVLANTALTFTVAEDAGVPSGAVGSLVSALTGGITDVDSGAVKGIAITGSNQTNGIWYYTTNGGSTWTEVGVVSNTSALLLADNASTRLYFSPNANYNGTSTAALTVRAWDQTNGSAGSKVSTASNGGTTAFSSATDSVDVTVTAVNDVPTDLSNGIDLNTDGGNDAYLISDMGLSQSLTAMTVEIRFAANDTPYEPVLISFNNPTGDELAIQIDEPSKNLEIDFGAGAVASASAIDYRAALVDGTVHTLSVTWDSAGGNWSVYIDGAFIESGTGLSTGTALDTTNGRFVFGQEQDAQNSAYDSSQYFSGTFYDVRVWNDVRTAGEIAQYYQQQLDVTPAEAATVGLVANWQMDGFDGSNQVVDLVSGNNLSIAHASGAGFTAGAVDSQLTIDENSANGSHVGFVMAEDSDASETFSYSLTDSAGGRFAVNSVTGELTVADGSLLDYEAATSHSVTVRVTDAGGLTYDETFTINLIDLNEAPILINLSGNTVAENAANGTVVGTVSTTDPDASDAHTYSLVDSAGGRFAIDGSTGVITVADGSLLDYESAPTHSITIRTTDTGGLTHNQAVTINLTNINEAPTGADVTITINEDTSHTLTTANFGFSDVDAGDSVGAVRIDMLPSAGSLTLSGVAVTAGQIITVADITAGNLVFTPAVNANGTGYASLTFSVRDSGDLYDTGPNTLTFDVTTVNDSPVLADTALTLMVAEDAGDPSGAVGSLVSAFTGGITDVDSGASKGLAITGTNETNGIWYYTTNGGGIWTAVAAVSNTSALLLADNGSTRLYFSPGANYNGTSSAALTLRAWDQTNGTAGTKVSTASNGGTTAFSFATDTVDVTVTAVNDAPMGVPVITGTVTENQTLTADTSGLGDADGLGTFSYQWLRNGVAISGETRSTYTLGDADVGTQISVTVRYTDGQGTNESMTSAQTAPVVNVNDAPVLVTNTGGIVTEAGTDTITSSELAVTDVDNSAAQLTYAIGTGPTSGRLELTTAPGVSATTFTQADIAANRLVYVHDGAETTSDSFTFTVNDGAGGSLGATTVTLTITPVNDAPTIISNGGGSTASINVAENVTAVTIVTGADVDLPAQALTYSLSGGMDQALFTINAATGALNFTVPPDFEVATDANGDNVYVVQVQVTDSQGASTTQTIQVTVTDATESLTPSPAPTVPPVLVSPIPQAPTGGSTPGSGTPPPAGPVTPVDNGLVPTPAPPETMVPPLVGPLPLVSATDRLVAKVAEEPRKLTDEVKEIPFSLVNEDQKRPLFTFLSVEPPATLEPEPPETKQTVSDLLMAKLDEMTVSLEQAMSVSQEHHELMARVTAVAGTTLSVGFVAWALRSGAILASCLAIVPAWRHFDPLPVVRLSRAERTRRREEMARAGQQEATEFSGLKRVLDDKPPLKRTA